MLGYNSPCTAKCPSWTICDLNNIFLYCLFQLKSFCQQNDTLHIITVYVYVCKIHTKYLYSILYLCLNSICFSSLHCECLRKQYFFLDREDRTYLLINMSAHQLKSTKLWCQLCQHQSYRNSVREMRTSDIWQYKIKMNVVLITKCVFCGRRCRLDCPALRKMRQLPRYWPWDCDYIGTDNPVSSSSHLSLWAKLLLISLLSNYFHSLLCSLHLRSLTICLDVNKQTHLASIACRCHGFYKTHPWRVCKRVQSPVHGPHMYTAGTGK